MTQLIEFKSHQGKTLKGLLDKADSERGAIFIHGFERTTVERKFKVLVDALKGRNNLFRFDFSGCGLSDGDFFDFSIDKSARELTKAIDIFVKNSGIKELILVGHSLGACIILHYLHQLKNYQAEQIKISKLIFLAPAFNQKELLRYYFVKAQDKDGKIDWENYREFLDEEEFLKDVKKPKRMTKEHWLSNEYFLENKGLDYNDLLEAVSQEVLVIHGDSDDKVPLVRNRKEPNIVVQGGDHDLQRPDMVEQYLGKVIEFL